MSGLALQFQWLLNVPEGGASDHEKCHAEGGGTVCYKIETIVGIKCAQDMVYVKRAGGNGTVGRVVDDSQHQ